MHLNSPQITFKSDESRNAFKINKISQEYQTVQTIVNCIETTGKNFFQFEDNKHKKHNRTSKYRMEDGVLWMKLGEQYTPCTTGAVVYLKQNDKIALTSFYNTFIEDQSISTFWGILKLSTID